MIDFLAEVADVVLDIILSIFSEKHRKRKALKKGTGAGGAHQEDTEVRQVIDPNKKADTLYIQVPYSETGGCNV